MIRIFNEDLLPQLQDRLQECLKESMRTGKRIDVTGIRQIGKTTALINFARSLNLPVIVWGAQVAKMHRDSFGYKDIYYIGDILKGVNFTRVLVDEQVDICKLESMGFTILAGYEVTIDT